MLNTPAAATISPMVYAHQPEPAHVSPDQRRRHDIGEQVPVDRVDEHVEEIEQRDDHGEDHDDYRGLPGRVAAERPRSPSVRSSHRFRKASPTLAGRREILHTRAAQ